MEAKKSLGQNFFVNKNLSEQIVDTVLLENPEVLIEIGPGKGYFTEQFLNQVEKIVLVEKDDLFSEDLTQRIPNATIINKDFLEWDFKELEMYKNSKIVFFGSLPYNVSKVIIKKILRSVYFTNPAFFIIQKEVAEKYIAKEPDNNLLSLQTGLYADVKRLINIGPESFSPRPKVNSSFVSFIPNDTETMDINIDDFLKFLNICFQQPRKTLRNNLKNLLKDKDCSDIENLLSKRPQHLSLRDFLLLFNKVWGF